MKYFKILNPSVYFQFYMEISVKILVYQTFFFTAKYKTHDTVSC